MATTVTVTVPQLCAVLCCAVVFNAVQQARDEEYRQNLLLCEPLTRPNPQCLQLPYSYTNPTVA